MKYASVMYLHKGCEAEYKKRHDELWPELAEHLKAHGIRDYYIYLDPNESRLYATFEADNLDQKTLANHPVMQRWWEYMADIMATKDASFEPLATPLEEVFRFNLQVPPVHVRRPHVVAVLDIGKTNIKVCLMDAQTGAMLRVSKHVNQVNREEPYPHADVDDIWQWFKSELKQLANLFHIASLSITTHGATVACMKEGELALPILDYEYEGVEVSRESYHSLRPAFDETYSPELPQGLNMGLQLYWLSQQFPDVFAEVDTLLMYPQYWGYKLTGNAASEVTSLGCHTDLWNPIKADYSSLISRMNWQALFPPIQETGAKLGVVRPELIEKLGLPEGCVVFNGIHDSNASLVPYITHSKDKLTVVSSGTWTVIATMNGSLTSLDESKDMLANVDAYGRPTATIRFMGGREWEYLRGQVSAQVKDLENILSRQVMAIPGFAKGGGLFATCEGRIHPKGTTMTEAQRSALADIYVALMVDYCLDLSDVGNMLIVEGAFSHNVNFLSILACLRPDMSIYASRDVTGTSGGAALLSNKSLKLKNRLVKIEANGVPCDLVLTYKHYWRENLPG